MAEETVTLKYICDLLMFDIAPGLRVEFRKPSEIISLRGVWTDAPILPMWKPRVSLRDGLKYYFTEQV